MFDAPIGDGANLFIWLAVGAIAFAAALIHIDLFKAFNKKSDDKN